MEFLSPKFTTHKKEKKIKAGLESDRYFGIILQPMAATMEFIVGMQNPPW